MFKFLEFIMLPKQQIYSETRFLKHQNKKDDKKLNCSKKKFEWFVIIIYILFLFYHPEYLDMMFLRICSSAFLYKKKKKRKRKKEKKNKTKGKRKWKKYEGIQKVEKTEV